MNKEIIITENQKQIINRLNDSLYNVEFLQEWINRNDDIEINSFAALQSMSAKGFYRVVLALESDKGTKVKVIAYKVKAEELESLKCGKCGYIVESNYRCCKKCGEKIDWSSS